MCRRIHSNAHSKIAKFAGVMGVGGGYSIVARLVVNKIFDRKEIHFYLNYLPSMYS